MLVHVALRGHILQDLFAGTEEEEAALGFPQAPQKVCPRTWLSLLPPGSPFPDSSESQEGDGVDVCDYGS